MAKFEDYVKMSKIAKRVGGPKILGLITIGIGTFLGIGGSACMKRINSKTKKEGEGFLYTVTKDDAINDEIKFNVGEKIRVFEVDKDISLVEKIGDENSPYYVPLKFIKSISDYE